MDRVVTGKKISLNFNQVTEASATAPAQLLTSTELMNHILQSLEKRRPLSMVSVGQTEAFVMAQYTLYSEEEFMQHREAFNANRGERSGFFHRGIRFPNIQARDAAVDAVKKADLIGYNLIEPHARNLTERVFEAYNIKPRYVFEANLRRVIMFSQKEKFAQMLQGRKILLVSSLAPQAKAALERNLQYKLGFKIVGAISIYENEEIPKVKKITATKQFDLCLIAAGVNAVILAPYIAEKYGVVALDIGSGMQSLITEEIITDQWIEEVIGLQNLLRL